MFIFMNVALGTASSPLDPLTVIEMFAEVSIKSYFTSAIVSDFIPVSLLYTAL